MKKIIGKVKNRLARISKELSANNALAFKPSYRVASIEKNKHGDFEVIIQLIGKAATFKMKPEEVLADDKMTDQFSPRDVRTLTYLGYLDINTPKYRILAKRLSEKDNRMVFAVHKKGEKNLQVKTASEISQDEEIIKQIDQQDAHMIGYTAASEAMLYEKREKERALTRLKENKNISE